VSIINYICVIPYDEQVLVVLIINYIGVIPYDKLPTVPLTQISDKYNTVIYNARESINSGLINTLPTPVYHMV
jgi:hypothetical protein